MDSTKHPTALLTVHGGASQPSLESAARQLGVSFDDIDLAFGVVPVDPGAGLYCVQVRADRVPEGLGDRRPYVGPFANPEIAPFGPVDGRPPSKK